MSQDKPQSNKPGVAEKRPTSPGGQREEAHPGTSEGDSKQPYASEVNDYRGGKAKPPKESPNTADG